MSTEKILIISFCNSFVIMNIVFFFAVNVHLFYERHSQLLKELKDHWMKAVITSHGFFLQILISEHLLSQNISNALSKYLYELGFFKIVSHFLRSENPGPFLVFRPFFYFPQINALYHNICIVYIMLRCCLL